jgi:hypothetical protein
VPRLGVDVVERRRLARRLVIEHVRARQPPRQPRGRHEQPACARVGRGLGVGHPRDLGSGGLRGETRSADPHDLVLAEVGGHPPDLLAGAGVDAVEDGRTHGHVGLVDEEHAGSHAAHADSDDLGGEALLVGRCAQGTSE